MKNHKNILIGGLLIAIVAMSIGYAALAQQLTITAKSDLTDASWKIQFEEITLDTTASKGATEATAPTASGTAASFDVKLAYPGAKAVYKIKIKNAGTIDAYLKSIAGVTEANAADPTAVQYTVTGVEAMDELDASAEDEAIVTVEWVSSETDTVPTGTTSKTATIYLNYEQAVN